MQKKIVPRPLAGYAGPELIHGQDLVPSDQFGGLLVTVGRSGGIPASGMKVSLGAASKTWNCETPEIHFMEIQSGKLYTLPAGTYDVKCQGHFESLVPGLGESGVRVGVGEIAEVKIDSALDWSKCRITLDSPGKPLVGGMVRLSHVATGVQVLILVSHFDRPLELWIPSGTVSIRAEARSDDPSKAWRCVDENVAVGGGKSEAPQEIKRMFELVDK